MLRRGATTTMEAWQPEDKANMDWAHPWCASPNFLIVRWLAGLQPLAPGWARARAAPQPSDLAAFAAVAPTPLGVLAANFSQGAAVRGGGVALALAVPASLTVQVCLPPLQAAGAAAAPPRAPGASDTLEVDGTPVPAVTYGRLLCTLDDVGGGAHTVIRM